MKPVIYFLLFLLPAVSMAQQSNDQRTVSTKIADVLAKFPADNSKLNDLNVQQLASLGEEGLLQMARMLAAPGKGDNTAIEFAIGAYTNYVLTSGKGDQRKTAINVYGKALDEVGDDVSRQFLIKQLELIGNDAALSFLQPYINNERLSGPATRAIAAINTQAGGDMLLKAYSSATAGTRAPIIEALGHMRYAPAAATIETAHKSGDASLRKIAAYALARIGNPSSAELLHAAAKKAGYTYDTTDAASYYVQYLQQLAAGGQQKQAAKLAGKMMSEASAAKQTHARIAALTMLSEFNDGKTMSLLLKAMKDDDIKYRGAALKLAERFRSNATDKQWLSHLKSASPEAKVQIINYLAGAKDENIATSLDDYALNDKDSSVRHAAIKAVGKLMHGPAELELMTAVLQKGNAEDVEVVKQVMLRMDDEDLVALSDKIDVMPPKGAIAALEVAAARRDERVSKKVFSLINSKNAETREAALKALPSVVNQQDLKQLYSLLTSLTGNDIPYIQDAVTMASAGITDTIKRISAITGEMNNVPGNKKYLFVPTLAAIGGPAALRVVDEIYSTGGSNAQSTVVSALSKNKDTRSASMLLKIADNSATNKNNAVDGYISIIENGDFPEDQKVVMLEEAMSLAANDAQRKRVLQEAGRNRTYLSLEFAAKYLDDQSLKHDAAYAVMRTALAHPEYNGQHVHELLQKVSELLNGRDSQYERQAIKKHLDEMPAGEGFVPLFNGKDLSGWKGLVENPIKRSKMTAKELDAAQKKADEKVKEGWEAKDGLLMFTGHGDNLATVKQYGDFEMLVDWKITPEGDAGIYLRGTPQVQIWDTSRHDVGAQVGSGGLYNNEKHVSKPLVVADNPVGEWNNFRIIMKDDKVTVYLNGQLVTDNVVLENYWDRSMPIFPKEQIELQAHGTNVAYRNLYIRELPSSKPFELPAEEKKEGFKILFDGSDLDQWVGNKKDYVVENNELVIRPSEGGGGGNLYTKDEYSDFNFRFDFLLTPGANNGLGIRAPLEGDAAYEGMELQILDNDAEIYKDLHIYQYHGSVYGVIPAKRGYLKPVGQWNSEEVIVKGTKIKVILNGEVILDGDIQDARDHGTADKRDHPGLKRDKGHIGFLGHGSVLKFRNIRIKPL
jgi:HEAT repeat protein